jgi:hypothetical protein
MLGPGRGKGERDIGIGDVAAARDVDYKSEGEIGAAEPFTVIVADPVISIPPADNDVTVALSRVMW